MQSAQRAFSKPTSSTIQTLLTGLAFGESPRWHDGRLWFSNWGAQEIMAADLTGKSEVILHMPSFPFSIDWLSNGRMLITSGQDGFFAGRNQMACKLFTLICPILPKAGMKSWSMAGTTSTSTAADLTSRPGRNLLLGSLLWLSPMARFGRWPMALPFPTAWRYRPTTRR